MPLAPLVFPCSWGAVWQPQDTPTAPAATSGEPGTAAAAGAAAAATAAQQSLLLRPDPRSTLHAVVQLLARLTKNHALAERVGGGRGVPVGV